MKNRQSLQITLAVISALVLGLGVAYAALSTTLNITFNTVTQSALNWNVGFVTGTVNATTGGTSATGRNCGTATVTASTVTLANTTLSKPGDSCTYALQITNGGDINAELTSITPTKPTSTTCETASGPNMVCGNITYKLATTTDGTTSLETGQTLSTGTTKTIYLIATYTGTTTNSTAITQNGASFALNYAQA